MNCSFCKNFGCTTYHQPGFGSRESMWCKKTGYNLDRKKEAKDCKDFEEGKSTTYIKYL